MLNLTERRVLTAQLEAARRTRTSVTLPRVDHPELTLQSAYAVQQD